MKYRFVLCTSVIYSPQRVYMDFGPDEKEPHLHKCVWKLRGGGYDQFVTELIYPGNLVEVELPF